MTGEPPLIERARRAGWGLLLLALLAMAVARMGPDAWRWGASAAAIALALTGLLAIVNVALVRSLYRGLDAAARAERD